MVQVPQHLVANIQAHLDLEGVEARSVKKIRKKATKPCTSEGPLWVVFLEGHDKLCGYQNWTFALGIYGCMDTFSRKVLFLFVCYLQFLYETETLPTYLRTDRGTETDLELEQFNI